VVLTKGPTLDSSIPLETRERVLAAARELNYIHTPRVGRVEQVNTRRLVFVMPDTGDQPVTRNPFFGEVLAGVDQAGNEQQASVTFTVLPHSLAPNEPLPSALQDRQVDGVLLVGVYRSALVERIAAEIGHPVVLIDNTLPGQPYDSVMADDFGGGFLLTQHLITIGHRHITMVAGNLSVPSFAERYRGYRAACRAASVQPMDPIEVDWERSSVAEMLKQVLALTPQPTAFFCASDAYAAFVMEALHDAGLKVPDDISVAGFDDLAPMRLVRPALTTIHNHPRLLGRLGALRLLARIAGDRQATQGITVGTHLVVRESTR
jgi:LacI family transcriptional regulator